MLGHVLPSTLDWAGVGGEITNGSGLSVCLSNTSPRLVETIHFLSAALASSSGTDATKSRTQNISRQSPATSYSEAIRAIDSCESKARSISFNSDSLARSNCAWVTPLLAAS